MSREEEGTGIEQSTGAEEKKSISVIGHCERCRFFQPIGEDSTTKEIVGLCKRFPPHPIFVPGQSGISSYWPILKGADGCAEYESGRLSMFNH